MRVFLPEVTDRLYFSFSSSSLSGECKGIGEVLDDWRRVPLLNYKMKWQFENFASASGRDMTAFIGVSPRKRIEGAFKFH